MATRGRSLVIVIYAVILSVVASGYLMMPDRSPHPNLGNIEFSRNAQPNQR